MRRIFAVLLCLCLLMAQVSAAPEDSLENILDQYIHENGLTENNFSLSFYNSATGEQYDFNEDAFFPAGRVWILPLHMYYCQEESQGAFEAPRDDPYSVYTIDGKTLNECRTESILRSNEAVEEKMMENVGTLTQYQTLINDRFGRVENPSPTFYSGKNYSSRFLMNCLKAISKDTDIYGELMRNFAMVQTSDALNGYHRPFSMTQVRGEEKGYVCAVAEVSAPDPYLIAAFASVGVGGDQRLAEINDLICTYVEEHSTGESTRRPADQEDRREQSDLQVTVPEKPPVGKWIAIALGGAAALGLIIWLVGYLIFRIRMKKEMDEDDEDE